MAEANGGYDALIAQQKWHSGDCAAQGGDEGGGRAAGDQRLEMEAVDGEIAGGPCGVDGAGSVGDDQAYMFLSDSSEQKSLGDGIFYAEPLNDGAAANRHNNEMLSPEPNSQTFEGSTLSPDDLLLSGQKGLSTNAAETTADGAVSSSRDPDNPHPLGSSRNPIRIIQQGNKYTSLQELSQEQLSQIMQVHQLTVN